MKKPTHANKYSASEDTGSRIGQLKHFLIFFILFLCIILTYHSQAQNNYYISVSGSDASGNGSSSKPWQTISKAAAIMNANDVCIIKAGTYRETIRPANSGTAGAPITFMAESGASVTVSGADVVSNWGPYGTSGIYQAPLSGGTDQVLVGGQEMILARWPNTGLDLLQPPLATMQDGSGVNTINDSNIPGGGGTWNGATVWFCAGYWPNGLDDVAKWSAQTSTVTSHTDGKLTINTPPSSKAHRAPSKTGRYYIANKLFALDAEYEWFADGTSLYVMAPGKVNPNTLNIEAKKRRFAIDLNSRSYISIKGINVIAATANLANAQNCTIANVNFKYVCPFFMIKNPCNRGGNDNPNYRDGNIVPWWNENDNDIGIYMSGSNNILMDSKVEYSHGDGVTLNGSYNTVQNCTIHDCNISGTENSCIAIAGVGHVVDGNTMSRSGRAIIDHHKMSGGKITYNNMFWSGLLTRDLGMTYTAGSNGNYAEIAYNWVHDNLTDHLGSGIYLDNGSSKYNVHHNVVWNTTDGGMRINEPGTDDQVYNNTFWNTLAMQAWGKAGEDYMTNVKTYNNLSNYGFLGTDQQNNLMTSDAKFAGSGNDGLYYRLSSGSPAIDYGRIIPGFTDNYKGSKPDAGAYEYGGTAWTAGVGAIKDGGTASPPSYISIPSKIEGENYTNNSGLILYSSSTASNGQYAGHYTVNSWSEYNVHVSTVGTYTIDFRIASANAGTQFQLKNGSTLLATVDVGNTGGWETWTTVTKSVTLVAGDQTWRLVASGSSDYPNIDYFEVKGSSTTPPPTTGIVSGSVYEVTARHSGKALDVNGGPTATQDGANVQQWTYGGGTNQQWKVEDMGGGYYKLTAMHSGKVLDVSGSGTADGTNVQQWTSNGTDAQRWMITDIGSGYYKVISKVSGKALDVFGGSTATGDGVNVQQWTYGGGTNQQWAFTLISAAGARESVSIEKKSLSNENAEPNFNVYPNPANGIANVSYTATHNEQIGIHLYDTQGRLVKTIFTGTALKGVAQNYPIDGSSLREGLYIIKLKTSSETINKKLIFDK